VEVEGVLQEQFIHGDTGRIGVSAGWNATFAISFRIHIETAAGEQNSLDTHQQPCDTVLSLVQGDNRG
jgi:hypothetical protein